MIAALICAAIISCSSSDDDDTFSVTGNYTGTQTGKLTNVGGTINVDIVKNDDAIVNLTDNGNGTYTIVTPNFTLGTSEKALTYNGLPLEIELVGNEAEGYTFSKSYNDLITTSSRGNSLNFVGQIDGVLNKSGQLSYTLELNHASSHFSLAFTGAK